MQPNLFEIEPTKSDTPRCRMCAKPARWNRSQHLYDWYCNGSSCNNRERLCQCCGEPFATGVDGAGTKYCSTKCKDVGYYPTRKGVELCAWCHQRSGYSRSREWPYICSDCTQPINHLISRLKNHHVPHQRAQQLLQQPLCEICGRDIIVKVHNTRTGKSQALLVVDHDHRCCPSGAYSCGQCVRGLICTDCNCAAGLVRDDPDVAVSLAAYLARFAS